MTQIKDALVKFNPWWTAPFATPFKNRDVYDQVKKFLPLRQLITFSGLRRVGKTTLMLKIVQDALTQMDAKHIVYFSFDEFKQTSIHTLLDEYAALTELNVREGKYMLLLDEVQKLDDWENQVKTIYDIHENMKIIVSGSESLFIRKKSRETLAGRMFEFKVDLLSFQEFLGFQGMDYTPAAIYKAELKKQLQAYVHTQGFPEMIGNTDPDVIRKYVKESIVEKIVFKDLPTLVPIRDVAALESLLEIIMNQPGQLIDINKIAQEIGINRQTASLYLTHLENAFLVRKLYNYSNNQRKSRRKLKKYYPTVVSTEILSKTDEWTASQVFEWLIVQQSHADYFWRDAYKNEVDVILPGKTPTPIEIKYGKIDTHGVEMFMKKFNVNTACIVTPDTEKTIRTQDGKNITVLPAWRYLLQNLHP